MSISDFFKKENYRTEYQILQNSGRVLSVACHSGYHKRWNLQLYTDSSCLFWIKKYFFR